MVRDVRLGGKAQRSSSWRQCANWAKYHGIRDDDDILLQEWLLFCYKGIEWVNILNWGKFHQNIQVIDLNFCHHNELFLELVDVFIME